MKYKLIVTPDAEGDLERMDQTVVRRIVKKLLWIEAQDNPLKWTRCLEGNPSGDCRFRIGDYRAVGVIKGKTIQITKIGHRSDVYR